MPVYPQRDAVAIHRGRYFEAEWYYTDMGRMPALELYNDLSELDKQRFDVVVKYFCEHRPGTILPVTIYRAEDPKNKIYVFKPGAHRFFNFTTVGSKVVVTNAYRKHSQAMTKQDLEVLKVAARYRDDYLRRISEGNYYET